MWSVREWREMERVFQPRDILRFYFYRLCFYIVCEYIHMYVYLYILLPFLSPLPHHAASPFYFHLTCIYMVLRDYITLGKHEREREQDTQARHLLTGLHERSPFVEPESWLPFAARLCLPFPFLSDFLELFIRIFCFSPQIEPLTWISLKLIKSHQIVLCVSLTGPFLQSQDGVSFFCQLLVFFHAGGSL